MTWLENLKLLAASQNKITEDDIVETLKMVNLEEDVEGFADIVYDCDGGYITK